MAYDKIIIDSAKFEGAVKATADAIRAKTRGTEKLPWDESTGFASSVSAITPRNQSKTVTPKASSQTVKPDSGYDGLSQVTVNGDSDLKAANIKKGTSIFGITGTLESGGKVVEGQFIPAQYSGQSISANPITISGLGFKPSRVIVHLMGKYTQNGATYSGSSINDGLVLLDTNGQYLATYCEEEYDEYEDEYYEYWYIGDPSTESSKPKITLTSDGFKISADYVGTYNELTWYTNAYRYIAFS